MCVLAVVLVASVGCSTGEGKFRAGYDFRTVDKIAVIDVLGDLPGEAAKNQISDFFVAELLGKGFAPVERAQVQSILKEQKFQASEMTSSEAMIKAGQILNVPVVLVINIPEFDDNMSMTAKMIDVKDGSILWTGIGSGKTGKWLGTMVGAAAGAAAGATVASDDNQGTGAVIGGVLGGVAAHQLSPQAATKAREVIGKMCESMPERYLELE
jgi:uncharacterized protein YcfJ